MVCAVDTDDDIEFVGGLRDHLDVDLIFAKDLEDRGANTVMTDHVASDDGDEGNIAFDGNGRAKGVFDFRDDIMGMLCDLFFGNGDAEHIHARRGVFDADVEAFKYGKDLSV